MNKKNLLLVSLLSVVLSSCVDTAELYGGNQYIGGDFLPNCYSHYDEPIKKATVEKTIPLVNDKDADNRYFNGSGSFTKANEMQGFGQAASWHPEDFEGLSWTPDIIDTGIGVWADQTSLIGKAYGQTKKMTLINSAFGRGYLSKLYNGQIRCNAWSSYAIVELDRRGYGTMFPAEMRSAKYFGMALRGGSDTEYPSGRTTTYDINVTFYKRGANKELVGTKFAFDDVVLQTNNSSEYTALVGFYFNEIGEEFSTNGIVGMSVDFCIVSDNYEKGGVIYHPSDDFLDEEKYHNGLILYEVFFPDSSWY